MKHGSFFVLVMGALALGCGSPTGPEDSGPGDDAGEADAGRVCAGDEDCTDGLFCTGEETCASGRCVAGAPPTCSDGIDCTADRCDEVAQACRSDAPDLDGDGFGDATCLDSEGTPLGTDCDDADSNRFAGNRELCDDANHDEDCDPMTFGEVDGDGDGFLAARCCNGTECGDDCDDSRPGVHPGVSEVCNGLDDDCDGMTDEGVSVSGFVDSDFDGRGDDAMPMPSFCPGTLGVSELGGDCDDADPNRYAGAPELCDLADNDCDGTVDESPVAVDWYRDDDMDGFGSASSGTLTSCELQPGYTLRDLDCDDTNAAVNPSTPELCNGIDDNCNGVADFQIGVNDYEDDDGDGIVDLACGAPLGEDCDDADPATGGGALEICDGRDNDCDGNVDEGATDAVWYRDTDGDGWGSVRSGAMVSCTAIAGYVARGGDCDDMNTAISPDAAETCDGLDEDCNGAVDDGAALRSCALSNASSICAFGSCRIDGCLGGFEDCDGDHMNGCEQRVDDVTSCGCRAENCSAFGGLASCVRDFAREPYRCEFACMAPLEDCDGNPANGCESDTTTDRMNCGGCGLPCFDPDTVCAASACTLVCPANRDDCDARIDNGCETDIDRDDRNCGSCGNMCASGVPCIGGTCMPTTCAGTLADCNANPTDGCEVDTATDPFNCGRCFGDCGPGGVCTDGLCDTPMTCTAPFEDCDGMPTTICETDTSTSEAHCGGCGMFCGPGDVCVTSMCQRAEEVVVGGNFTCARLGDGTVWCWGGNESGQLGDGTLTPRGTPGQVTGINDALQLAAGAAHVCALRLGGAIACWGSDLSSQIGGGCAGGRCTIPTTVVLDPAARITAGDSHTCAIVASAPTDQIYCWGRGDSGQLGDNAGATSGTPALVIMTNFPGVRPLELSAGGDFSCAQLDTGDVTCWGGDTQGQLGDGIIGPDALRPLVRVALPPGFADTLASGDGHSCARVGPDLYCWGASTSGQVGTGSIGIFAAPARVTSVADARSLGLGLEFTCLSQSTLDRGQCFGNNTDRAMGNPSAMNPQFTPISLGGTLSSTALAFIARGPSARHMCAITNMGELYCWGANFGGQVGDGTNVDAVSPLRVVWP